MDDDGFWCIDCALQHLDLEVSERTAQLGSHFNAFVFRQNL